MLLIFLLLFSLSFIDFYYAHSFFMVVNIFTSRVLELEFQLVSPKSCAVYRTFNIS